MRTLFASLTILLLVPALAAADHPARTEEARYVSTGYSLNFSVGIDGTPVSRYSSICDGHVNGACFGIAPGDSRVDIRAADDVNPEVAIRVTFLDGDGDFLATSVVCAGEDFEIPPGAVLVGVATGWDACAVEAGPVALETSGIVATTGVVTATFT